MVDDQLLPAVEQVAEGLFTVSAFEDGTLLQATGVTMKRLLLGYIAGVVLGVPLGAATQVRNETYASALELCVNVGVQIALNPKRWRKSRFAFPFSLR